MKKLVPIGVVDYKKLRKQGYYYIDKTLLIKDVLKAGEVALITRPRRFGKTLNLSMLRYFFEKTDESNQDLFEDTNIWQHVEFQELQGQYPVIFLSFRTVNGETYDELIAYMGAVIAEEYQRHAYLLSSDILEPFEKDRFERIRQEQPKGLDLERSIEFLGTVLSRYHKKKVMIFIDEYDVPVQNAYVYKFYDKGIAFMRKLLTRALKDFAILERAVITGNLLLAKAGIFTGLNNFDSFNLTRQAMANKFGFTQEEVDDVLDYFNLKEHRDNIKSWYNGYTFGATASMYNPWSLLKCISNDCALKKYWANTSDNLLLKRVIARSSSKVKASLEGILQGKQLERTVSEHIVFADLDTKDDVVWTLLVFTGYLTYTTCKILKGAASCMLVIPNEEIRSLYEELITDIFVASTAGGNVQELIDALLSGNAPIFASLLQEFVLNSVSAFDLDKNEPEKSSHLFILGLLVWLLDTYEVKSNRESGFGRYDILLLPKDPNKKGIIIEFKKVYSAAGEKLEDAAKKALEQVIAKNYAQELTARKVSDIIAYGIAFEGKKVFADSKILQGGV